MPDPLAEALHVLFPYTTYLSDAADLRAALAEQGYVIVDAAGLAAACQRLPAGNHPWTEFADLVIAAIREQLP